MQYEITYDSNSGFVLGASEQTTATIISEISDSDYEGLISGQKQLFVRDGAVVVIDEPMAIETREALYEAPSE